MEPGITWYEVLGILPGADVLVVIRRAQHPPIRFPGPT